MDHDSIATVQYPMSVVPMPPSTRGSSASINDDSDGGDCTAFGPNDDGKAPSLDDPSTSSSTTHNMGGPESLLRFLLLPSQVGIVLLLEFLNSFRSFGLRFVLYNYVTNELGIGDTDKHFVGVSGVYTPLRQFIVSLFDLMNIFLYPHP